MPRTSSTPSTLPSEYAAGSRSAGVPEKPTRVPKSMSPPSSWAAQKHTGPQSQRLLRDQKKLHHLYGQLSRLGFAVEHIEACLPHLRADTSLADALDWCCLHLPKKALPRAFRLAGAGDSDVPSTVCAWPGWWLNERTAPKSTNIARPSASIMRTSIAKEGSHRLAIR